MKHRSIACAVASLLPALRGMGCRVHDQGTVMGVLNLPASVGMQDGVDRRRGLTAFASAFLMPFAASAQHGPEVLFEIGGSPPIASKGGEFSGDGLTDAGHCDRLQHLGRRLQP
jgi:hypothetical protein